MQNGMAPPPPTVIENLRQAAPGMVYGSGKRFDIGLSCVFRQHLAVGHSHCGLLHGYDLIPQIHNEAGTLDHRNWVVDHGGLKPLKSWLEYMFDHTVVVAEDDPELETFTMLHKRQIIDLRVVQATGTEAFARLIYERLVGFLNEQGLNHAKPSRVVVHERDANFGWYGVATDNSFVTNNLG